MLVAGTAALVLAAGLWWIFAPQADVERSREVGDDSGLLELIAAVPAVIGAVLLTLAIVQTSRARRAPRGEK